MKPDETIAQLRKLKPIGRAAAEACDSAIDIIKKSERFRLHDLTADPSDLPVLTEDDQDCEFIVYADGYAGTVHYDKAVCWAMWDEERSEFYDVLTLEPFPDTVTIKGWRRIQLWED